MKTVALVGRLARGRVILIDDKDYEIVGGYRWRAQEKSNTTYAVAKIAGKNVKLHRLLLPNAIVVDHKNGDGLDNRRENLRPCSQAENLYNAKKRCRNNVGDVPTSKFKGVSFDKRRGKWYAYINVNKQRTFLGSFDSEELAAQAYAEAIENYCPEFGRLL